MGLVVTQEHIDRAVRLGACETGIDEARAGRRVDALSQSSLLWAQDSGVVSGAEVVEAVEALASVMGISCEVRSGTHLSTIARNGNGNGDGNGYGYGDGNGNGNGDGYGDGNGYGYGYGDGNGNGYGYGYGDGNGYGYGYGNGYGYGYGYGDGYGDGNGYGY